LNKSKGTVRNSGKDEKLKKSLREREVTDELHACVGEEESGQK